MLASVLYFGELLQLKNNDDPVSHLLYPTIHQCGAPLFALYGYWKFSGICTNYFSNKIVGKSQCNLWKASMEIDCPGKFLWVSKMLGQYRLQGHFGPLVNLNPLVLSDMQDNLINGGIRTEERYRYIYISIDIYMMHLNYFVLFYVYNFPCIHKASLCLKYP